MVWVWVRRAAASGDVSVDHCCVNVHRLRAGSEVCGRDVDVHVRSVHDLIHRERVVDTVLCVPTALVAIVG